MYNHPSLLCWVVLLNNAFRFNWPQELLLFLLLTLLDFAERSWCCCWYSLEPSLLVIITKVLHPELPVRSVFGLPVSPQSTGGKGCEDTSQARVL